MNQDECLLVFGCFHSASTLGICFDMELQNKINKNACSLCELQKTPLEVAGGPQGNKTVDLLVCSFQYLWVVQELIPHRYQGLTYTGSVYLQTQDPRF